MRCEFLRHCPKKNLQKGLTRKPQSLILNCVDKTFPDSSMVEHSTVNRVVTGSSPVGGAKPPWSTSVDWGGLRLGSNSRGVPTLHNVLTRALLCGFCAQRAFAATLWVNVLGNLWVDGVIPRSRLFGNARKMRSRST